MLGNSYYPENQINKNHKGNNLMLFLKKILEYNCKDNQSTHNHHEAYACHKVHANVDLGHCGVHCGSGIDKASHLSGKGIEYQIHHPVHRHAPIPPHADHSNASCSLERYCSHAAQNFVDRL